ncbi:grasp-with-spasm system SPASM domain peptide maturase [Lewinella cohaerens]|uniref:grasp-with-spasm system SPASM domain peptide maturase n=1 Tax=Lewinella cohaerens TaxID=70995 RepID=UPI00037D2902|nr:grasp-with-spasm system SPASM domain peptide maturase [Lewinella cohaerens]
MLNDALYFKLFASCIPVKGSVECLIYDTDRGLYHVIDPLLFEIINENKKNVLSIGELKKMFLNQYDRGIDAYFQFFVDEEIGFFTDNPQFFPEINMSWHSPLRIQNAVIEVDESSPYDLLDVLRQLEGLNCQFIQLRFLSFTHIEELKKILDNFDSSCIKGFEVFIPYYKDVSSTQIIDFTSTCKRIARLHIFEAPEQEDLSKYYDQSSTRGFFIPQKITCSTHDVVSAENFFLSLDTFLESQQHNIGLNRKVSIDRNGFIKNYLSHETFHGNVCSESIKDVISTSSFQKCWFLHNDIILVCKDCQYRYMCVDNTEIIKSEGGYRKNKQCSFNPYTNKW